jgi:DNA-binding NarL/FixJ family response regulator
MAGELAISICEMALTGQCSSDNGMIDIILENFKVSSNKNKAKYDKTLEVKRQKKINDQSLDKIAILLDKGYNQSQIARQLNISK